MHGMWTKEEEGPTFDDVFFKPSLKVDICIYIYLTDCAFVL